MKLSQILFFSFALVASLYLVSCQGTQQSDKYRIALTIAPSEGLIKRMLDSSALAQTECHVLLPSGAIPENYEPTVETVAFLERCDAWYYVGDLGFESQWVERVRQINPDIKLVRLDQGLRHLLVEHSHGNHKHTIADPHYWFSIQGLEVMSRNIASALREVFPDKVNTGYADSLIQQLSTGLEAYRQTSATETTPDLLVYHPALTYLASELGIRQMVIEQDGKEPSPQHLAHLARQWCPMPTASNTPLSAEQTLIGLGGNPRLVVLREYRELSLALAKTYGLQTLMANKQSPYILDIFAEDIWAELPRFYPHP